MISQEVLPNVYVFDSRMLTMVVRNLDGTLVITWEWNMVHNVTIILKNLAHLK
jgi:hypothetical protein